MPVASVCSGAWCADTVHELPVQCHIAGDALEKLKPAHPGGEYLGGGGSTRDASAMNDERESETYEAFEAVTFQMQSALLSAPPE